nr:MAG TPA: hypothetical protein [Caudoviricetes sp.]
MIFFLLLIHSQPKSLRNDCNHRNHYRLGAHCCGRRYWDTVRVYRAYVPH